jgi:tetratricopeptide (TPR) repeat protein
MTIQEFLGHIKHPEVSGTEDTAKLRDLVNRFPYCTSSQILLAYRLFRENDLDFPNQLKKVAAYASNRKKLKQLFNEFTILPEITYTITESRSQEKTHEEHLLAIVRRRLEEIKLEREREATNEQYIAVNESTASVTGVLSKNELVEKFIHDTPRLSPPKASFFSPSEKAVKSNQDDEEIVSETLAYLFYKQGNVAKAIKIYDKLILLFPEKSSYFAAQIEKMNASPSSSAKEEMD